MLSYLVLSTASHALGNVSLGDSRAFLANLLEPAIVVLPVLLAVVGYAAWRAFRENGPWRLLALALLFQAPVCLLLVVQRWALRQFLIPQTLVFCILAALVTAAGAAALAGRRPFPPDSRRRSRRPALGVVADFLRAERSGPAP